MTKSFLAREGCQNPIVCTIYILSYLDFDQIGLSFTTSV